MENTQFISKKKSARLAPPGGILRGVNRKISNPEDRPCRIPALRTTVKIYYDIISICDIRVKGTVRFLEKQL
jgi:hypothetical protein